MLKKAVRLGILTMLVVSLALGVAGTQPAKAISSPILIPAPVTPVEFYLFDAVWGGDTYEPNWPWADSTWWSEAWPVNSTIGEVRQALESMLGYPVVLLTHGCDEDNYSFIVSDSARVSDYACSSGPTLVAGGILQLAVFKKPSSSESARLTLYGYVNDDGKSCVLWSLDGSHPVNVDSKCGGGSELVCTVKLVEKKLKYNCDGGYDWLGEQIVNDPKWLEWADKFASMNGKK